MRGGLAALAVLMLAACSTEGHTYRELEGIARDYERGGSSPLAEATTMEEATRRDSCGAAQYRTHIGQPVSGMEVPARARVIGPGTAVTDDFRPSRLNIITDAGGTITAMQCY